jgi:hypothetical protein
VTRRCAIVLAAVLGGCGPTGYAGPPEEAFAVAVEAHLSGDGTRGGEAAQVFLEATTEDDGRYDRAQLILAESLEDLGFHQAAAMVYLDVASSAATPSSSTARSGASSASSEAGATTASCWWRASSPPPRSPG